MANFWTGWCNCVTAIAEVYLTQIVSWIGCSGLCGSLFVVGQNVLGLGLFFGVTSDYLIHFPTEQVRELPAPKSVCEDESSVFELWFEISQLPDSPDDSSGTRTFARNACSP